MRKRLRKATNRHHHKGGNFMKNRLKQWLSALLAVCLLFSVTTPTAFAAINGYADLSDESMLVGGTIEVLFSGTATSDEYYNVQIADESWSTTYVNEYITSGNSYTISGLDAGTYQIYVGYYENGSWVSDALYTTFTVTEETPGYALSLSIRETTLSLGDTVNVSTVITADGTVYDIPNGCTLSIWYQNDNEWVTPVDGSSTTDSTEIYLSDDNFTAGNTYTVYAALYDSSGNVLASDSEDFTVAAASTNGTAELSSTTMTESGSITVNFSGTATSDEYYNVQIADESWSTTYVNTNITSGDSYTISGYSAGTYNIYVGYYEDGTWQSTAYEGNFTVTEDSTNGTATLSSTVMTESGSITVTFSGTATSDEYYNVQIFQDDDWDNKLVDEYITSGNSYTIEGYSAGTYQIYVGYCESAKGGWVSDALEITTFTVTEDGATSYGLSLSISDSAPALGDTVDVSAVITVEGTDTGIPDGCTLSIWYQNDNDWVTPVNGSSTTTSTNIYLSSGSFSAGNTYTVYAELYDSSWNVLASDSVDFTVRESSTATETYTVSVTPSATTCEQNESITFAVAVTCEGLDINLSEQSDVYLWIWADSWADGHGDGLTDCSISPNTGLSNSVTVTFPSVGTYYIAYTLEDSSYSEISKSTDVATITVTGSTADPSEDITTGDIDNCSFMRGMDLSTFYTNWEKGAVYYDYEGTEYSAGKDNAVEFFEFLYNVCGVNWVRLRVWNDPYDEDGNPYGGGNNNVETAAIIGKWASEAGMTVLIDFHYSDFWADPGRQLAPKAWADMDIDEKVEALYEYTYDSLDYLLNAGVNVGMVQVGNETNGAFCGEAIDWSEAFDAASNEAWQNICALFSSGSSAVRDISFAYGTNIKVALHFTNPNNANPSWYAGLLDDAGVDYDAMGISYYMYWHGTLDNLQNEIETVANNYGKEVFIAETAYPYTSENYDDLENQVTSFDDFDMNANLYAISEAGQEAALTAILDTAASSDGCTGLFYWEPAWTALRGTYDEGTGWATKWASDYISYDMDASEGSSFDNQTLFDDNGYALPALSFFADYVKGVENLAEHTYVLDEDASFAATCTADGRNVYVCSVCGDSYTETVSATGHTAGDVVEENNVAATCTTDGSYDEVVYCSVCGEELSRETVTVPATGHSAGETVTENEVAATCTENGSYDSVVYCSVCGEELSRETVTVPAAGHDYVATTTIDPTCTAGGYTIYTCSVCGDSYTADETEATGHSAGETVTENEVAATCTTDGSYDEVVYCTVCGEELSRETVTVPATGHTEGEAVVENEVAVTHTEDGSYDLVVYCTVCGEELSRETVTITADGHSASETVTENEVAATCTTDGSYDIVVYCSVCGEELSRETVTVPATGHSYEAVVTAPTCTEGGYTTYTCSACGDTYVADETEATGHSWDEGTVITAATCTEEGVMSYTCTVCGEAKTETIPMAEHQYEAEFSIVDNTASASRAAAVAAAEDISFIATLTCTVCGNVEVVDATETGSTTTDVTCTEDGTTIYTVTCTYEGKTYTGQVVVVNEEATGHTYVDGVCVDCGETAPEHTHTYTSEVTVAAACTTDGVRTYTCTFCGDTYTEVIPATGHDYVVTAHTDADCSHYETTTYTCTVCGDSYTVTGTEYGDHVWDGDTCTVCGEKKDVKPSRPTSGLSSLMQTIRNVTRRLFSFLWW